MFAPREHNGRFRGRRRRKRKAKRAEAIAARARNAAPSPKAELAPEVHNPPARAPAESLDTMVERARIDGLGRADIKAELERLGIEYDGRTSTDRLRRLLLEGVDLADRG